MVAEHKKNQHEIVNKNSDPVDPVLEPHKIFASRKSCRGIRIKSQARRKVVVAIIIILYYISGSGSGLSRRVVLILASDFGLL